MTQKLSIAFLQVIFIFVWSQVVVKLEVPAYEDRTSLNFMRSFSRTPSPTCSLNHPIYESVEKRGTVSGTSPRARLYTADYAYAIHRPGSTEAARTHRRSESCDTRPHRLVLKAKIPQMSFWNSIICIGIVGIHTENVKNVFAMTILFFHLRTFYILNIQFLLMNFKIKLQK